MAQGNSNSYCLLGNWYEERFFHADHRKDEVEKTIRPLHDDVENLPRVTRRITKTGECFQIDDPEPEEIYQTTSELAYQASKTRSVNNPQDTSVTYRRMHCTGEELGKMLDVPPPQYLPNYSLAPIPPEEQFKTTYQASYNH